jgi:hypothetical protein
VHTIKKQNKGHPFLVEEQHGLSVKQRGVYDIIVGQLLEANTMERMASKLNEWYKKEGDVRYVSYVYDEKEDVHALLFSNGFIDRETAQDYLTHYFEQQKSL